MIKCANCKHDNLEGTVICVYCGELVDPKGIVTKPETSKLENADAEENQPRWGTARFDENTRLFLRIVEVSQVIGIDVLGKPQGLIVGRRDPETSETPDVDLTTYGAAEMGVSRRHAQFHVQDDALRVTDLGSANATYLNGLRLTAHQPRILRDGDELRLGKLKIQVTFVNMPRASDD